VGEAIRTVVTGISEGRSTVVRDDLTEPITPAAMPGYEFYRLWGNDTPAALPTDGARPETVTVFPPVVGTRFWLIRFPADSPSDAHAAPLAMTFLPSLPRRFRASARRWSPTIPACT
jgi:hypothetical protein